MDQYLMIKRNVSCAMVKESYVAILAEIWSIPLSLPMQFLKEEAELFLCKGHTNINEYDKVSRLIRDLSLYSVSLNGNTVDRGSQAGPERIIGGLVRCILEHDRTFPYVASCEGLVLLSEVQAIIYARDVLLTCTRT